MYMVIPFPSLHVFTHNNPHLTKPQISRKNLIHRMHIIEQHDKAAYGRLKGVHAQSGAQSKMNKSLLGITITFAN